METETVLPRHRFKHVNEDEVLVTLVLEKVGELRCWLYSILCLSQNASILSQASIRIGRGDDVTKRMKPSRRKHIPGRISTASSVFNAETKSTSVVNPNFPETSPPHMRYLWKNTSYQLVGLRAEGESNESTHIAPCGSKGFSPLIFCNRSNRTLPVFSNVTRVSSKNFSGVLAKMEGRALWCVDEGPWVLNAQRPQPSLTWYTMRGVSTSTSRGLFFWIKLNEPR